MFLEFQNILGDSYRTTWHEVLNEHFPKPLEEVSTHPRNKKNDFKQVIELFIKKILDNRNPGTYSISIWPPEAITALRRIYLPCRAYTHIALKRCFESPSSFRPAIFQNPRMSSLSNGIICGTIKTTTKSSF
jgi:hypothetical protein